MGPNVRALLALGVISLACLWFRSRTAPDSAEGSFLRRAFLLLAVATPAAGLLIPMLPWKIAALLLVAAVALALALIQRRG